MVQDQPKGTGAVLGRAPDEGGTLALVVRNACRGARLYRAMRWLGAGLVPSGNIQRLTLAAYVPPQPCGRGLRPCWARVCLPCVGGGEGTFPPGFECRRSVVCRAVWPGNGLAIPPQRAVMVAARGPPARWGCTGGSGFC